MDVVAKAQEVVAGIRAEFTQMTWEKKTEAHKLIYEGTSPNWTVFLWPSEITGGMPMGAASARAPFATFSMVLLPKGLVDEALRLAKMATP